MEGSGAESDRLGVSYTALYCPCPLHSSYLDVVIDDTSVDARLHHLRCFDHVPSDEDVHYTLGQAVRNEPPGRHHAAD